MRTGIPGILILTLTLLAAGCIQLPGMHILRTGPDPVIGQWVGGELPASDLHVILYENQTYFSRSFYLDQGDRVTHGTWTRSDNGLVLLRENSGNITSWMYDPTDDSLYLTDLPQRKYYRFRG